MNLKNTLLYCMAICMLGAFAQSYAGDMGEKEKKGEEDKKLNFKKVIFIKKYTPENSAEEKTTEVFAITLEPAIHYYTQNPGSGEVCIGLSQNDFSESTLAFPFAKFFGKEQEKAVIENAQLEAISDYKKIKDLIKKIQEHLHSL